MVPDIVEPIMTNGGVADDSDWGYHHGGVIGPEIICSDLFYSILDYECNFVKLLMIAENFLF